MLATYGLRPTDLFRRGSLFTFVVYPGLKFSSKIFNLGYQPLRDALTGLKVSALTLILTLTLTDSSRDLELERVAILAPKQFCAEE